MSHHKSRIFTATLRETVWRSVFPCNTELRKAIGRRFHTKHLVEEYGWCKKRAAPNRTRMLRCVLLNQHMYIYV